MLIEAGYFKDSISGIKYNLVENIPENNRCLYLLTGENGVGKTRFIEGVLLKELRKRKIRILYFSQDIENQILSFELIYLVKDFIHTLKKSGTFFKTILFNHDSHKSIELDFDNKRVLNPDSEFIKDFIEKQTKKFNSVDIIVLDEIDKYFYSTKEFTNYINSITDKSVFIISHILEKEININREIKSINLTDNSGEVKVETT